MRGSKTARKNRSVCKSKMNNKLNEQAISDILTNALLAGKLAPGLRLGEQNLADLFGVTRERMRKVLHRLGHQRLIELHPNRGAFVAEPGLREARQVYEARRILETGMVFHLASTITQAQIATVNEALKLEQAANDGHDHAEAVRLSGRFHLHLAEMTSNEFIVRQMQELVSRTAMLVAYHEAESPRCGCDEHRAIFAAICERDAARASREMQLHLSLIETRLQQPPVRPVTLDLDAVIGNEIKRWRANARVRRTEAPEAGRRRRAGA
jgi:DNA-binding GntR family transcriptional regulator